MPLVLGLRATVIGSSAEGAGNCVAPESTLAVEKSDAIKIVDATAIS